MTWLELYKFLSEKIDKDDCMWPQKVMIHNIETGDEYTCETLILDHNGSDRVVLSIRYED